MCACVETHREIKNTNKKLDLTDVYVCVETHRDKKHT